MDQISEMMSDTNRWRGTHLQKSKRQYRKEGRRRYCSLRSVGNDIGLWLVITPLGPDHRPLFMQARETHG